MKFLAPGLLLLLSALVQGSASTELTDLTSLQWQNRIVLVTEFPDEEGALALLRSHSDALDERDVVWFVFGEDRVVSNYSGDLAIEFPGEVLTRYARSAVTLIGKDGGVKARLNTLDLKLLLATIDAMPMRRSEMRR